MTASQRLEQRGAPPVTLVFNCIPDWTAWIGRLRRFRFYSSAYAPPSTRPCFDCSTLVWLSVDVLHDSLRRLEVPAQDFEVSRTRNAVSLPRASVMFVLSKSGSNETYLSSSFLSLPLVLHQLPSPHTFLSPTLNSPCLLPKSSRSLLYCALSSSPTSSPLLTP